MSVAALLAVTGVVGYYRTRPDYEAERQRRRSELEAEANCAFYGFDCPEEPTTQATTTPTTFPTTTFADPQAPVEPTCPQQGSLERQIHFTDAPPMCIDTSETYVATVRTNYGDFEMFLDDERAPQAVNNFVFLALWNFYDGVVFDYTEPRGIHRVGDPTRTTRPGQGGPGYELPLEVAESVQTSVYPEIPVVMATGSSEELTHGSQFVIVLAGENRDVFEETQEFYTLFGRVTEGHENIAFFDSQAGDLQSRGKPAAPVVIEDIVIEVS